MAKALSVVLIVIGLLACAPKQIITARVQVIDLNNHPVHTIDDATSVAYVQNTLNNRIRAIVKKQPEFRYRLQWEQGAKVNEIWLYDGFGFIALDGKEYEAIYRVDDVDNLNKVLHVTVVDQQ